MEENGLVGWEDCSRLVLLGLNSAAVGLREGKTRGDGTEEGEEEEEVEERGNSG
jgi:hypothetical protein